MAKFCSNGHQMEDSWEICPYCQRTGFQTPTGAGGGPAKTRLETEGPPPLGGAVHARQDRPTCHPREHQGPGPPGWPARTPNGATAGSTGNWPGWEYESPRRRYGRS